MAEKSIEKNEAGHVTRIRSDQPVLEPESPEAVQVPEQQVDSNHLNEAYKDADEHLEPAIDTNVKLGDRTAELLDQASRTHQTAPLTGRSASDAGALVNATGGQHAESATVIVQEETARREQERREQAEESKDENEDE